MTTSDERYTQLVKKHHEEELQAWRFFRFELERRWDLLYPGFDERDYFTAVEDVVPSSRPAGPGQRFLKEHFQPEKRGWFQENRLGEADGLVVRARQRIRSRYHCSITSEPAPGFSATPGGPSMQSWQLYLTPAALTAGMKLATSLDYAVTLSTPRAGASERSFHFLAMPRLLRFDGRSYLLYKPLEERSTIRLTESAELVVELVRYPAFCLRASGDSRQVAALVWRLADGYASLLAFNLVITPGADIERSSVFFFPRPWRPVHEGPQTYAGKWTFGAFEMGGFFVQANKNDYESLTYEALSGFLTEVSIFESREERQRLTYLLRQVLPGGDVGPKIEGYGPDAG